MVRRFEPEETGTFKPLYWIAVVAVILLWIWAFKLYFDRYEYLHPEITWAVPGVDHDIVAVKGVLLWKEVPLLSGVSGVVSYPQGTGPVRVARGSVVAHIAYGSKSYDIKAYQQGYFIAGVDGLEPAWRYSELWPGDAPLPEPRRLVIIKDGMVIGMGQPVGKLIEQPQELRFIGYADVVGNMSGQIKNETLKVKMDGVDTVSTAEIRVSMKTGRRTKLYLTLPWFQPEVVLSRKYTLIVEAGMTEGAMVPNSAVMKRKESMGVYMVRGSRVVFKPVEGKPADNGKFLVTKGISVGDAIVEDASTAREGRIQLW